MSKRPRFAVIGNPIAHSLSPEVHGEFARSTGIDLEYGKLFAPKSDFAEVAQGFFDGGGCGMNVTAPFKGDAAAWVDDLDDNAALTESVNTIAHTDGALTRGYSTDGPGLVADLATQWNLTLADLAVLIIGAGGATRGILPSLLAQGPRRLVIANRTLARAEALATRFAHLCDTPIEAQPFESDTGDDINDDASDFDLVIHAISGQDRPPSSTIAKAMNGALCYDISYALGEDTAFCREARQGGAKDTRDGLGMLVWQAAYSFEIWHGVLPDAEAALNSVLKAVRGR